MDTAGDGTPLPTSRVGRGAALGTFAAKQTLRRVVVKAGSVALSEARRTQLLDRADAKMARDFVAVLGEMRGAAMKIGQLLSFIDLGIVDERSRPAFRAALSRLQGSVDALPFEVLRPVIESELGPLDEVFAAFDTHAFAAASIGQVYRARTHDGRTVAVKVQYPGVRTAVRADLKNLALFLRMWRSRVPTVAAQDFLDEITGSVTSELDYRQEFVNQARLVDRFAGHPFIHIPAPVPELSSDSVLTTEYVDGINAQQIAGLPAAERDRIGEIIYRFYLGSLFRNCEFNGDAHPGNFLYLPDRRVAFLDFGLYKRMTEAAVDVERQAARLCLAADGDGLRTLLETHGVLRPQSAASADDCLQYTLDAAGWNFVDDYVVIDPAEVSAALLGAVYSRSATFQAMRSERLPPEHLFSRRLDFMVFGAISHIGAGGNWYRVAAEWIHDAPPVTPLGIAEAEWRAGR